MINHLWMMNIHIIYIIIYTSNTRDQRKEMKQKSMTDHNTCIQVYVIYIHSGSCEKNTNDEKEHRSLAIADCNDCTQYFIITSVLYEIRDHGRSVAIRPPYNRTGQMAGLFATVSSTTAFLSWAIVNDCLHSQVDPIQWLAMAAFCSIHQMFMGPRNGISNRPVSYARPRHQDHWRAIISKQQNGGFWNLIRERDHKLSNHSCSRCHSSNFHKSPIDNPAFPVVGCLYMLRDNNKRLKNELWSGI